MIDQQKVNVLVNGSTSVDVLLTDQLDLRKKVDGTYSLIHDAINYHVEVLHIDIEKKELTLSMNGKEYTCHVSSQLDMMIKEMGLLSAKSAKKKEIKAPMPGKVLELLVKSGDEVSSGEGLLILEAMKMENVIKAPHDLIVKDIKVSLGQAVEKGEVLLKL